MKKAIITGASSGLGYEIAKKLLDKGVKVVNLSRTPSKLDITNLKTDLEDDNDIKNAIKNISKDHSDVDLLVFCAGVLSKNLVSENPYDKIDRDFAINTTSIIKLTSSLMPLIKEHKGDVVIVGSTSSFNSYIEESVYASTKHAVLGFIKALQTEFKKQDVRIMGFHPGGFKSQLHIKAGSLLKQEELMNPENLADLLMKILEMPRNMEVSEIIINRKVV